MADPVLDDLATNDIYWDKVVDIASIGRREVYELTMQRSYPVVAKGLLVRSAAN